MPEHVGCLLAYSEHGASPHVLRRASPTRWKLWMATAVSTPPPAQPQQSAGTRAQSLSSSHLTHSGWKTTRCADAAGIGGGRTAPCVVTGSFLHLQPPTAIARNAALTTSLRKFCHEHDTTRLHA